MFRTDTDRGALREQIRLLRQAGPERRIAAACSLTQQTRTLSWRSLAGRMPGASDAVRRATWAALLYGDGVVKNLGVGTGEE